ncbi:MAG: methionyl-tRNA formyltransferase [bacterium]|nr:methionyl-tRNA formyltransferase [bacterium]MDZ4285848.1 methionyl-tRNA formyltransferase [Candidatus Sungbacteria bacterium]
MINISNPRIVFFGTPDFAVPSLDALVEAGLTPELVVTNPDEPAGRKQILTAPPIKIRAEHHGIPVLQPVHLAHEIDSIPDADLYVVVAFGTIIPQAIIDKPRLGTLNIHPSLLPHLRGPSPIQSALLNGDPETGVSLMKIDELMDHGPVIAQETFSLSNKKWTSPELHVALAEVGARMLIDAIPQWVEGKIEATPQDDTKSTYCKLIKKDHGRITWSRPAQEIERMIRAYTPWPSAWTLWPGRDTIFRIRIDEAEVTEEESPVGSPGYTWDTHNHPLLIKTGKGSLIVKKITIEGKTPANPKDFLRGNPQLMGATFV